MSKQIVLVKWFSDNKFLENYVNSKISEGHVIESMDISHTNTMMNGNQYLLSLILKENKDLKNELFSTDKDRKDRK